MRKLLRKIITRKPPVYAPAIPDHVWAANFRAWAPIDSTPESTDKSLPVWLVSYQHWSESSL